MPFGKFCVVDILFCVAIKTASTKLSDEVFALQHSLYAVSKFELDRPNECRKMASFATNDNNYKNMNMKEKKILGL